MAKHSLTASTIAAMPASRVSRMTAIKVADVPTVRAKMRLRKMIDEIVPISLFIISALCALWLVTYSVDVANSEQVMEEAKETAIVGGLDNDVSYLPPVIDFAALQAVNPEVCGWIRVPGTETPVDYPIVAGHDQEFYLNYDWKKNQSWSGAIFCDYKMDNIDDPYHPVIYGHHMRSMVMFHDMANYKYESYADQCPIIWVETPATTYRLRVIGSYETVGSDYVARRQEFSGDAEFQEYLDGELAKLEWHKADAYDRSQVKKLFTFVTCGFISEQNHRICTQCVIDMEMPTEMVGPMVTAARTGKFADEAQAPVLASDIPEPVPADPPVEEPPVEQPPVEEQVE